MEEEVEPLQPASEPELREPTLNINASRAVSRNEEAHEDLNRDDNLPEIHMTVNRALSDDKAFHLLHNKANNFKSI